jgi:peptide subunit release factor 1 (eRF1)
MAGKWEIVCKPEGKTEYRNPDEEYGVNMGAMRVLLVNGDFRDEVSRVGFVRRNTKNPDTGYKEQLHKEVDKARASVEILNDQLAGSGEVL